MRALRRGIVVAAWASAAATVAALALWVVGVVVSDRALWSQPISFVPREWMVWGGGAGWVVFAMLSLGHEALRPRAEGVPWRRERRGRARVGRLMGRLRGVLGVLVLVATGHLVVVEWRWPINAGRRAVERGERFRVIHWNVGWSHPVEVCDGLILRESDLAIVVNPLTRADLAWDFDGVALQMGGGARVLRGWPINVISRWPVRRWGVTQLGFTSRVSVIEELRNGELPPIDPGHAMFVELEVGEPLGRVVVVWIIDLPSEPELHRPAVTRQARERIEAWLGPGGERFPEPDVMIGDFNIPAGSWSLMGLRRREWGVLSDAHGQGGMWASASWPARRPLLRIDQCFVGPGVRAAWYSVEDGGDTRHRMQVVDLVAGRRGFGE